jgi:L-ascorbate metabolism protein UlaG (beta-lactamase superfamily)
MDTDSHLEIRRLGWAGIELASGGTRIAIDPLVDMGPLEPFTGPARTELAEPSAPLDAIVLTHLHSDHADPVAVRRHLKTGGRLLRPPRAEGEGLETIATEASEHGLAKLGLSTEEASAWDEFRVGPFTLTAVPAVDGFGDPQVSWVIAAGGRTMFHGGDTIFHGSWWLIAMRHGPFDHAFMPINGPVCDFPHRQPPSPLAAALDPVGAATAAYLLGAREVIPIHYDSIHAPPVYAQVDDPLATFKRAATEAGVRVRPLEPGATLS